MLVCVCVCVCVHVCVCVFVCVCVCVSGSAQCTTTRPHTEEEALHAGLTLGRAQAPQVRSPRQQRDKFLHGARKKRMVGVITLAGGALVGIVLLAACPVGPMHTQRQADTETRAHAERERGR
jgi:hypothetical protein